jgi:H+-translocating NAD(P) transhydrogenase subunit alpha
MLLVTAPGSREHEITLASIISGVKLGVPREQAKGEERVGLVPETVDRLVKEGFEVIVETGAGRDYNLDENYEAAGARVAGDAGEV